MRRYFSLLCILALLVGCYNTDEQLINEPIPSEDRIFTASFEQNDTRTYVEEGNLLRWNAGDQITIFDSNTLNQKYQFDGETGDNGGTFSKVSNQFGTGNDLNCHYAVYPYNKDIKITETGVITANLPAEQSYAENSFGLGANTMVAVTKDVDDTFLKFRNVGGYLKLQLYGENITVKSITLTGNNNEKLAGKATITPAYEQAPTLTMNDDATTSITLDCGDGVKIGATAETATAFWIVVPATTFEEGLTITVTEIDGESFTKSTSNAVVVERNIIKPMAAFEVEIEKIPNNQIWYTSSDGNVVTPNSQATFGVNIESNVYVDGKGVITFDGEVTTIGTVSFYGCYNLKSITIPSSITTIENAVFVYCPNLAEFKGKYASDGGRCLIKDNAIIAYANASGTEYTIPDNVTTVWNGAFGLCLSLSNITIPETVTTIQPLAFLCPNLKTINGKYATEDGRFYIIDGSIKIFAPYELTECVIPNSVITIDRSAFASAYFTSVTIPDSVTAIESDAFASCYDLTKIYCKATTPPTAVFNYNTWDPFTRNVIIYVPIDSVYEYRKAAGWNNYADRIVAFDYEKGEAVISNNIIYYTSVDGNIIKPYNIGEYVFGAEIVSNTYENGLGIIKFDRDVLSVGFNAFKWCNTLTSIVIPDSVAEIGTCAFYECSNLTSVTIGDKVTSIGDDAFRLCSNITSVHITDIESWCNIKFNNFASNPLTLRCDFYVGGELLTNLVIPNSVTSIGERAFQCCESLTSVTIPDSVTTIGNGAFQCCESLTSVTIPDSVTTIGNEAFDNCESLTSVTIGDSVTTIGERAFHSCGSLTSVTIGNSVTTIGDFAFGGCSLTSVTIPDSVVIVGDEAFYLCSNLREFKGKLASVDGRCLIVDGVLNSFAPAGVTEYNIPYGVTAIGNSAFYYCNNITKVTIPDSVAEIGTCAFYECSNLTSVTIGNNVITIGESAFEYCTSLSSMIIPDSVITIGDYALHYCKNLTNIVIGNHVTLLGQGVLRDCDNLTSVTMGDRVTTIGYLAFNDCDNLTAITIPASVTSIESGAFAECDKLTKIYCKSSTPTMVSYPKYWCAFDNNASYRKIYVPRGSGDAYKSASGWSDYASDIVEYDF